MYNKAILLIFVLIFALVFIISCGNNKTQDTSRLYNTPIEIKSPEDNSKTNNEKVTSNDSPTKNNDDNTFREISPELVPFIGLWELSRAVDVTTDPSPFIYVIEDLTGFIYFGYFVNRVTFNINEDGEFFAKRLNDAMGLGRIVGIPESVTNNNLVFVNGISQIEYTRISAEQEIAKSEIVGTWVLQETSNPIGNRKRTPYFISLYDDDTSLCFVSEDLVFTINEYTGRVGHEYEEWFLLENRLAFGFFGAGDSGYIMLDIIEVSDEKLIASFVLDNDNILTFVNVASLLPNEFTGSWKLIGDKTNHRGLKADIPDILELGDDGTGVWIEGVQEHNIVWYVQNNQLFIRKGFFMYPMGIGEKTDTNMEILVRIGLWQDDNSYMYERIN